MGDETLEKTEAESAKAEREKTPFFVRVRAFLRDSGWDLMYVLLALGVILVGSAIWYQPPLLSSRALRVSYSFLGKDFADAALYRPLAMPTRYYVKLPHELQKRYRWFSIDRRREVCALAEPPSFRTFGLPAIRRKEPLGIDLEFRHLDNSEWRVSFEDEAIVFSNAILCVRLDHKQTEEETK
ncbi:MAG: hypothetical protein IKR48_01070 [Kiritimatiellae bacterium]|nr:hypothetical protein [Kiritimatiellia bacterium]